MSDFYETAPQGCRRGRGGGLWYTRTECRCCKYPREHRSPIALESGGTKNGILGIESSFLRHFNTLQEYNPTSLHRCVFGVPVLGSQYFEKNCRLKMVWPRPVSLGFFSFVANRVCFCFWKLIPAFDPDSSHVSVLAHNGKKICSFWCWTFAFASLRALKARLVASVTKATRKKRKIFDYWLTKKWMPGVLGSGKNYLVW